MKEEKFDFDVFKKQAMERLKAGKGLIGSEGSFTPLIKSFLEEALEGELEDHLANENRPNRKNGARSKRVRTTGGEVNIRTPLTEPVRLIQRFWQSDKRIYQVI